MTTREDRIRGVVAGQAVGDALGSGYEFQKPVEYGKATFLRGTFGHPAGSWTDDTEQAACVLAARSDPEKLGGELLSWYRGRPRDVGAWTRMVLSRARSAREVLARSKAAGEQEAATLKPASWDEGMANGSLMRTGPVCLPFLGDREKVAEAARACSDVTHYDSTGYTGDACVLWSLAIERAVQHGEDGFDVHEEFLDNLAVIPAERRGYWHAAVTEALSWTPGKFVPNGGVVAAFKCALSAVAHSTTYEGTVQAAVAAGHDTDTVAAIAGALAGAIYGASSIPAGQRERVFGSVPGGMMSCTQLEFTALEVAQGE